MTRTQRYVLCFAILLIGLALKLPLWRIDLWAPQYPEGLSMQIAASDISGSVMQINILNHYIGMKHIIPDEIPELKIIPWVLVAIIVSGLLVVALNRMFLVKAWFVSLNVALIVGFIDFYRWGYDYGHNLSPDAPIKIPGLTYQPPLLGYKKILNIESWSLPDWGSYAIFLSVLLVLCVIFWELIRRRASATFPGLFVVLAIFLNACTAKVEPIRLGVDQCDHCRMQIVDSRFGAELITEHGRIYKFDSVKCMRRFVTKSSEKAKSMYVVDYFHPEKLISVTDAFFLEGSTVNGPMGPDAVPSADKDALEKLKASSSGEIINWEKLSGTRS